MRTPRKRGNRLGFRIFDIFISLGVGHAYALLRFVALHYLIFDSKARAATTWYVNSMWNSPNPLKRLYLIYKLFIASGEKLIDLRVLETGAGNVELQCDTNEMRGIISEKSGLIFFTAHAGNWQLMMRKLPDFGVDVGILKRRERNEPVDEFLKIDGCASNNRIHLIDAEDGLNATVAVMKELASGNIVSIMGDAPIPGSKTIPLEFLGSHMELPEGPFRLAAACSAPVIALFARKTGKLKYVLTSVVLSLNNDENAEKHAPKDKTRRLALKYTAALEAFLKKNPFEWTPGGRL
jgi:predicted LPLAT superfamily acyltransferase